MNRKIAGAVVAGLMLAAGLWWMTRPPPPNIVVILGCTLRRDQLTPYDGHPEAAPFLAQVRLEGTLFTDLVASSAWTKESSTAIFTGHQAAAVGMTEPLRSLSRRILPDRLNTLAEHLKAAGYDTFGVTANPHLNSRYGFDQGFDAYEDTASRGFAVKNKITGAQVVAKGLALLDRPRDTDNPFYLQLVIIDPHQPTKVGAKLRKRFEEPGVPARLVEYRANVRRVDDALRSLDKGLKNRGYTPENTLFVLVADHGEGLNLPEHHKQQHGRVLYPSLTSAPWILRGPGVASNHTVTGLASHLDFLPTILGIAGIDGIDGIESPQGGGHSFAAAVAGWWGSTGRERVFTETWYYGANRAAILTDEVACQRDWGTVGVSEDTFVEGCFDRIDDPTWTVPIEPDPKLMDALDAWRAQTTAAYEAGGAAADADDKVGTREQLEMLGYVEE